MEEKKKRVYYKKETQMKYNAENTKQYAFRINKRTDSDIIEKLESVDSKIGYIKDLIRADINTYNLCGRENPRF